VELLPPHPEGESYLSWYGAGLGILWPGLKFFTRRDWRGTQNLGRPGDGLILAANHISWFDPFTFAHFVNDNGRSPRFLAKASLFDVPVGGDILSGAHQIPVDRESTDSNQALEHAVAAVNDGESVLIYPEGTITRDPDMWPMTAKTGTARIALTTRKPVVPVAQWGPQEVMGPYRLEANFFPIKTMHYWAGEPVDLSDLYDEEFDSAVLAAATDRILDAITSLLAEIRGEPIPEGRFDFKSGRREPTTGGVLASATPQPADEANEAEESAPSHEGGS